MSVRANRCELKRMICEHADKCEFYSCFHRFPHHENQACDAYCYTKKTKLECVVAYHLRKGDEEDIA